MRGETSWSFPSRFTISAADKVLRLHVACTGDSRAVMGTYVPGPGGAGSWKAEALSEDQTGKSPSEVQRIKSEHPESESETVIARGRVLGGLEPSRVRLPFACFRERDADRASLAGIWRFAIQVGQRDCRSTGCRIPRSSSRYLRIKLSLISNAP